MNAKVDGMRDEEALLQAKAVVRKRVAAVLAKVTPQRRSVASAEVARRLRDLPAVRDAQTVMAFISMAREIDTWPILQWAWEAGKRVAVPRVEPPGEDGVRRIVAVTLDVADIDEIAAHPAVRVGAYGILEVPEAVPLDPSALDVVVVPCQAIDRQGRRLGKGSGFYDRFLADARLRAPAVAVAFQEQVVDEVPVGRDDWPMTAAVTDAETLWFATSAV